MRIPAGCRYIVINEIGGVMDYPRFFEDEHGINAEVDLFHQDDETKEDGYANMIVIDLGQHVAGISFFQEPQFLTCPDCNQPTDTHAADCDRIN